MSTKPVLVGIDALRFLAAFAVMCSHLCTSAWSDRQSVTFQITGGQAAFPELFPVTWFGWVGVEIFFVISGLVIAYSAQGASAASFARSRVLRLYPGVWICATLTAAVILALGSQPSGTLLLIWLRAMLLVPFAPFIDPVYWTLGIEMAFYGLIAVLLSVRRPEWLERLALCLGGVSSLYWIAGALFAPDVLTTHFGSRRLDLTLVEPGCCFAVGALAYIISRCGLSRRRLLAMGLFIVASLIEVSHRCALLDPGQRAWAPALLFLAATGLVFASMRAPLDGRRPLARAVRKVGLATYPLYLFHQIVGAALMRAVLTAGGSRYAALGTAMAVCVATSYVIANVIEPPVRRGLAGVLDWPRWGWNRRPEIADRPATLLHRSRP